MRQWNPQGSHLINVVRLIEQEFNAVPPVPKKHLPGGAQANQQAQGAASMSMVENAEQKEVRKDYQPEKI